MTFANDSMTLCCIRSPTLDKTLAMVKVTPLLLLERGQDAQPRTSNLLPQANTYVQESALATNNLSKFTTLLGELNSEVFRSPSPQAQYL